MRNAPDTKARQAPAPQRLTRNRGRILFSLERRWAGLAGDAQTMFSGHKYDAMVGQRAMEREITDRPKCYDVFRKLVSIDVLKSLFKPLLSDVDKYVPLKQHCLFLRAERTGRRTVQAVPKAAAAPALPKAA